MLSRALIACAALALAACGFQLAGQVTDVDVPAPVYIAAADRYTPFYLGVAQRLAASGIETTGDPSRAATTVTIRRDETGARVLSVSARNVPREFEVFYTVSYDIVVGKAPCVRLLRTSPSPGTTPGTRPRYSARRARKKSFATALAELLLQDFVRRAAGEH